MEWMHAITIIGSILVPMLAGFGWLIHRMDNKFDGISIQIANLDKRLSRLEGYIEGRESILKVKGE